MAEIIGLGRYSVNLFRPLLSLVLFGSPTAIAINELAVDDARFEVVDNQLKLKDGESLDHESEPQVNLTITATDAGGLSWTESFTLAVGDMNDAPVAGDDAASVHLESTGAGTAEKLWEDDFSGDWTSRWPMRWVGRLDRISGYFERDGETWLQVTYPEGESGTGLKFITDHRLGDRAYLEYKIRFADDFDWVIGGKLPGLTGGNTTAGQTPNGEDGFGVRFVWETDGRGIAYAYHPDMPGKWGEPFSLDNFWFQKGVVQTLGLEVVANTPGQHDGILRGWLDGVLVVEETDMRWRDVPELQIDGISFGSIFGGSGDAWAPSKDEIIEFGDFKIYDAPPWEGSDSPSTTP
jgi:hypothetical protein